jgi:hypothetical protein
VSVTGSTQNTHPLLIPSVPVSHTAPAPLPLPIPAPLADVPLTAVDADRIVQSDYLSPYCTEIAIRYSIIIPLLFASFHFIDIHLYIYTFILFVD